MDCLSPRRIRGIVSPVGKVSLTAAVVWSLVGLAGCSAIAGLDSIQEESCAPNCGDAGLTDGQQPPGDSSMQGDSNQADTSSSGGDTSTTQDSGIVGADTGGGGQDSGIVDTGTTVSDGPAIDDAPFDSACGNLNTTTNCGACGASCAAPNTDNETASFCCTGSTCPGSTNGAGDTCTYTCKPNYLDCNAATLPVDNDGCECKAATGVACCSGGNCPVQHDYDKDVVGATFYDCVAAGAFNSTDAMDACEAYAGVGQCDVMHSGYYCTYADGGLAGDMVCSDGTGAPACACWGYDGVMQGYLLIGPGTYGANENNCMCPGPGNPQWD